MKKSLFVIAFLVFCLYAENTQAQDIIVKTDGTILNVFNVEESENSFFFTLESTSDAAIYKISKKDVFSFKKKDGTTNTRTGDTVLNNKQVTQQKTIVVAEISSEINIKKGIKRFTAKTPDGHELEYAVISETERTVTVIGCKGKEKEYVIPENIKVGEEIYVVTEIGKRAFCNEDIENISFPSTLKKICTGAFAFSGLKRIVLPEGLEVIENNAFYSVNKRGVIYEIYLPSSLKEIENDCFLFCSKALSPKGYCKAFFSNIPSFITTGNCEEFGIDDSAVENFLKNNK